MHIKATINSHKKVIENYSFMTILKFLDGFFYLLVFPYLMSTIGKDGYGVYVFAMSIVSYCVTFVSFGFDMPSVKAIVENKDNLSLQSHIVSAVITAKTYLLIAIISIFTIALFSIPILKNNWPVFLCCVINILPSLLLQSWFFQGIQKMKVVTVVQFLTKLLSIVFIFLLVKTSDDVWLFALISSCAALLGGILAYAMMWREGVRFKWASMTHVKIVMKDGFSFFLTSIANSAKWQLNPILLGAFFTMGDVAIYDLAYKIVQIPILFLSNISNALFPKVMQNYKNEYVKKCINANAILSIFAIVVILLLGKYMIALLGGEQMADAYYFLIPFSLVIFPWIVVNAYQYFVFVPNKLYYIITKNQVIALVVHVVICVLFLVFFKNMYTVAIAMAISAMFEFAYSTTVIKKRKLLVNK